MQYGRRCGVCVCVCVCVCRSFRLRYIFSSHANTRRDETTPSSYTRARRTAGPSKFFILRKHVKRDARWKSYKYKPYIPPNETLSAKTNGGRHDERSLPPSFFTACEPRPLSTKPCATRSVHEPKFPLLSNKTASSDATFQKWRFPHSPLDSTRSFFTVETRVGSLNFWQAVYACEYVVLTWLEKPVTFCLLFYIKVNPWCNIGQFQRNRLFLWNGRYYFQD